MKIVLPGGTGQAGTILAKALLQFGHEVVVFSRNPRKEAWRVVHWDAETLGSWAAEIDGADVIINLAGKSVNCRYTPESRREILASRVNSTRVIGQAIQQASHPPRIWLQASTATIYAHRFDADNNEKTGIIGGNEPGAPAKWRNSIEVATAWEQALNDAHVPQTRRVALRISMLMSPDRGGVFDTLLRLARFGLGGASGNGRQYMSWIHDEDFVRAVQWIIDHEGISGPVNITAPDPLANADFMRVLRQAWGAPVGLPAPALMLEIGTFFMRTETELVLKSRRVTPGCLLESGFTFKFPSWQDAAPDLCVRWKCAPAR